VQYLGGKATLAKRIAAILQPHVNIRFYDVFCGALHVTSHIQAPTRVAIDACRPLIAMWRAMQVGWEPPDTLSREEYEAIRTQPDPANPLTAFAMFGCSYGGKWGAGYAGAPRRSVPNPVLTSKRSAMAVAAKCLNVTLLADDFQTVRALAGDVIYCDPPYNKTTPYAAVGEFDRARFWICAESWAMAGARVFVSEGAAADTPKHWGLVAEWERRATLDHSNRTVNNKRKERLYMLGGN